MSDNMVMFVFIAVIVVGVVVVAGIIYARKRSKMPPTELEAYKAEISRQNLITLWGNLNDAYICPHCQKKGYIHTKPVTKKKGISGAKPTGALLTGGLSILVTGLSRKEGSTQTHCTNCNSTWDF